MTIPNYARYERKDLDAWIFTNSSNIDLYYNFSRFDQISIQYNSNLSVKNSLNIEDNTQDYREAKCSNRIEIDL